MKPKRVGWLVIVALVLFLLTSSNVQQVAERIITKTQQQMSQVVKNFKIPSLADRYETTVPTSKSSQSQKQQSDVRGEKATPLESNVKGKTLKNVYYYRFASGTPEKVRREFLSAVKAYNATKIVKLVAGTGTQKQNQIVFSIYDTAQKGQAGVIELGVGGPVIIQQTGWDAYTVNHAKASLNVHYVQSVRLSVAMHELGHALGLDHSTDRHSVMYPVDQGRTALSQADLAALQQLYS
ncbi:matrixin family metalloprotease [Pediococcus cellicola]|uniref:matrixin family metalloprotease n=1 Tax=Pediococcus cellicola TaxID=319652 RepID=UPI000A4BE17F|nr:matrixin family metalloprotease [Pediococcus cellicola]GEL14352.1 peptidase M10 [Pediococcus cellicola]